MIPVESHFLYSIREQASFTWRSMVCELIDNAFDANASQVRLSWPGGKVFEISDDGIGTSDLMHLLTLGGRRDHQTNDIGKYGVGCKQALIWLWGVSEITSAVAGECVRSVQVDWDKVACGEANYPNLDNIVTDINTESQHGTRIKCMAMRKYPSFQNLWAGIANTYTPGIELGKSIIVSHEKGSPERLKCRPWPKTDEEIVDTIEAAGRSVSIRMGIVSQGEPNPYTNGFSFERTYRVIKESTLGANGFSVGRLCARITLSNEWSLSTNKDDFSEFQDELADAIQERCHDLMHRASEQAISFEDSEFNRELGRLVEDSRKKRRESRGKGESSGAVEPKDTGRKRQTAAQSSDADGSVIDTSAGRRKRNGFNVETYETDSATFGYYDSDGNRVRLNVSNKWLSEKYRERKQDALIPVIYGILAEHGTRSSAQKNPLFKTEIEGDFCENWGTVVEAVADKELSQ